MYKIYELLDLNIPDNFEDFYDGNEIRHSFWALTPLSVPDDITDEYILFERIKKNKKINNKIKNFFVKHQILMEDDQKYFLDRYHLDRENADNIAEILPKKYSLVSDNVYIGSGANGYAYKTNDNKILKITTDPTEVEAAIKLKGEKPYYLAWIYDVYKIINEDEGEIIFAILEEFIPDKPKNLFIKYIDGYNNISNLTEKFDFIKYIKKFFNRNFLRTNAFNYLNFLKIISLYLNGDISKENLKKYNLNLSDDNLNKLKQINNTIPILDIYNFMIGMVNIHTELDGYGLRRYNDYANVDNLGYKNNILKLFDIAKPMGYSTEIPNLDKKNTIKIKENNEIDDSDRLKFIIEVIFKQDFSDFFNKISNGDLSDFKKIKNNLYKYFEKNPIDKKIFFKYLKSLKNIDEDRKKSYMPGSSTVTVKKRCRLAGKGNTSDACNQGDINNLEFGSVVEDNRGYGIADKIYAKKGIIPQDPNKYYNINKNEESSDVVYKGDINDFREFYFDPKHEAFYIYKNPKNFNNLEGGTRGFILKNGDLYICSTPDLIHIEIFKILKENIPEFKNIEYRNRWDVKPTDYISVIKAYKENVLEVGDADVKTLMHFKQEVIPLYKEFITIFERKHPNIKISLKRVVDTYQFNLNEGTWEKYYKNNPKLQSLSKDDDDFEQKYKNNLINQSDKNKIVFNGEYGKYNNLIIVKNPDNLYNFPDSVRGVITNNGDLYIVSNNKIIHSALIEILEDIGVLNKNKLNNYYHIMIPEKLGFLTVQRKDNLNAIYLGESISICSKWISIDFDSPKWRGKILKNNNLPEDTTKGEYLRTYRLSANNFIKLSKTKNSNIDFKLECVKVYSEDSILDKIDDIEEGVADKFLAKKHPYQFTDPDDEFERDFQLTKAVERGDVEIFKMENGDELIKNPTSFSMLDRDVRGVILDNGDVYVLKNYSYNVIHADIISFLYDNNIITNKSSLYLGYIIYLPEKIGYLTIQRPGNLNIFMTGEGMVCSTYSFLKMEKNPDNKISIFNKNDIPNDTEIKEFKKICEKQIDSFINKARNKNPQLKFSSENIIDYSKYRGVFKYDVIDLKKRNYTAEGVGDKYLVNKYPHQFTDPDADLNKELAIQNNEIVGESNGVKIIKNPKNLKDLDSFIRGIVTLNGDLYVESEAKLTHFDLYNFLKDKHIIPTLNDDIYYNFEWIIPTIIGGISVIRLKDSNEFVLGASNIDYNNIRKDLDYPYIEMMNHIFKKLKIQKNFKNIDDLVIYFKNFLNEIKVIFAKAQIKNPKIKFSTKNIYSYHDVDNFGKVIYNENNIIDESVEYKLEDLPFKDDIEKNGGKIYSVGGIVRDEFLGKESKDLDILITGIPLEELSKILSKYGKVNNVGKQFGIIKFIPKGATEDIDIAIPRTEKPTGEGGHKGFEITSDHTLPIEDDLKRRDFTINAIAKDINGKYIDPFNGIEDLKNKIIRVVDPKAFADDPLRMLRAVQFASRFGFIIEPKTMRLIQKNAYKIKEIPGDRIITEFEKIVKKGNPYLGAKILIETNLYKEIFDSDLYIDQLNPGEFNNVNTISEFVFLLTKHNHKPLDFYKKNLRLDNKSVADIEAFILGFDNYKKNENPGYYRVLSHNMYLKSPRTLESKILPEELEKSSIDLLSGKYPKTVRELNINGGEVSKLLPNKRETGNILKKILINIYYDKINNNYDDILVFIKKIIPLNLNETKKRKKTKYIKTKESLLKSKNISKEMKENIFKYLGGGSKYIEGGRVHGLKIPKVKGKRFHGVSLGADKNGFYVYTHRAASKRYDSPEKIPQKSIDFIASTG